MRPILAFAAIALSLSACGKSERSAVSLEVKSDLAGNSATVTCRESTTGLCHVLFKVGTETKRASVAPGSSTSVTGLPAGTSFCGGYAPPELESCKPIALTGGSQVIRHERVVRN